HDPDLTKMEDEQLVVLAQEGTCRPARDELIRRNTALKEGIVRRYAARAGLQEADTLAALQDAVRGVMEAIRQYRRPESIRPQGCRFRTFLYRVLTSRLVDFIRHCRRLRNHFPLVGGEVAGPGPGSNPLRSVEEGELRACLD